MKTFKAWHEDADSVDGPRKRFQPSTSDPGKEVKHMAAKKRTTKKRTTKKTRKTSKKTRKAKK